MIKLDFFQQKENENYRKGRDEGFECAANYMQEVVKKLHKEMKKGLILRMATTSTATTHKCNCELCDIDIK